MHFHHVALDLDGTMVDTTASQTVALNEVLSAYDRSPLPAQKVRQIAVHGLRAMLREAFYLTGDTLTDHDLSIALDQLREGYNAHLLELTVAAPGLDRALRELNEVGVACTVLSNKPQDTVMRLLDHVEATEYIAYLVSGDMGYARKPDPGGLAELMRSTDTSLADTLMCGSMRIDMQTARNAGVQCAACSPFVDPGEMLALGADYMLHELSQLVALCTGRKLSGRFFM